MAQVAVVYHSGFGHTAVLASEVVQGVQDAGAEALLLAIGSDQSDFAGMFDEIAAADAVIFGSPTYMGNVSAAMKAFMEASEQGTDAPAAVVQQTLALVAGPDPVRALLLNTQTQTPATDRLRAAATSAGVPEVPVFETIGDPAKDYVSWMGAQIEDLGKALRRSA